MLKIRSLSEIFGKHYKPVTAVKTFASMRKRRLLAGQTTFNWFIRSYQRLPSSRYICILFKARKTNIYMYNFDLL